MSNKTASKLRFECLEIRRLLSAASMPLTTPVAEYAPAAYISSPQTVRTEPAAPIIFTDHAGPQPRFEPGGANISAAILFAGLPAGDGLGALRDEAGREQADWRTFGPDRAGSLTDGDAAWHVEEPAVNFAPSAEWVHFGFVGQSDGSLGGSSGLTGDVGGSDGAALLPNAALGPDVGSSGLFYDMAINSAPPVSLPVAMPRAGFGNNSPMLFAGDYDADGIDPGQSLTPISLSHVDMRERLAPPDGAYDSPLDGDLLFVPYLNVDAIDTLSMSMAERPLAGAGAPSLSVDIAVGGSHSTRTEPAADVALPFLIGTTGGELLALRTSAGGSNSAGSELLAAMSGDAPYSTILSFGGSDALGPGAGSDPPSVLDAAAAASQSSFATEDLLIALPDEVAIAGKIDLSIWFGNSSGPQQSGVEHAGPAKTRASEYAVADRSTPHAQSNLDMQQGGAIDLSAAPAAEQPSAPADHAASEKLAVRPESGMGLYCDMEVAVAGDASGAAEDALGAARASKPAAAEATPTARDGERPSAPQERPASTVEGALPAIAAAAALLVFTDGLRLEAAKSPREERFRGIERPRREPRP